MYSPIFESFYEDRARSGSSDVCVNLYPESYNTAKGLKVGLLTSTPGLTAPVITVGTGAIRGALASANGIMYVVSGTKLYSVTSQLVVTALGTIGSNAGAVSLIESPTQVLVVDGTGGWCWDFVALTFTKVIPNAHTNNVGPSVACYQDGFGLVNSANSPIMYQSNYNDLSAFATVIGGTPVANDAFVQGNPQNIISMFDYKEEAWIFKQKAIEVWINQGNPGFAFVPLQGVYIPVGCAAPASIARLGESLVWLGSDDQGQGIVYESQGYSAKPITTFALAQVFGKYATISDAIGNCFQWDGHKFYVLTFPSVGTSWGYDLNSGKWHQRAYFNTVNGQFQRELANCYVFFNGMNLVGDYRNGNMYALSDSVYTDNGTPRKWQRSWRALPESEPQGVPMSFDSLELVMETGITVPPALDPRIDLRFSDDGGYNWNGPFQMRAGKTGETAFRVRQSRLGSTTIGRGLDRVWEVSANDPYSVKIIGAEYFGGPA